MAIPVAIGSYGVCYALALAAGGLLVWRLGRTFAPSFPWVDMVFAASIAGYLGAKLANALVVLPDILAGKKPLLAVLTAGGVWLGAIAAGGVVVGFYLRRYRLPLGSMLNAIFVAVPTAHVLGRTGCFLGGCCYGKPTSVPWAIVFTDPWAHRFNGTPLGVPLHPTQLYEAGAEGLNAVLAWVLWRRSAPPGAIAAAWAGMYGAERLVLETFRGDPRGQFGPLSTSQWASLAMIAGSLAGCLWILRRRSVARGEPSAAASHGSRGHRGGRRRSPRSRR